MKQQLFLILALCATTLAWGTTVTKTYKIADIASNNDWTDGTAYTSFDLGEEFHIKAVGSTNGVYYTANNGIWRSYQGREKGEFTISAKAGYIITKIKVTYPATKNNGVLSKNPKPEGAASPASDQMASGKAYNFNASLVTLYVGNTDAATTSGQVSISQFEITYEKGIVETFDKLPDETSASTSDRTGDWFTWKITTGARHKTTDVLYNGTRSLWLSGNGGASMETKTTIEGGVKYVSFLWNKFNKTASPVKVSVTAGDVTRELEKTVQTGDDYNQNHPDLVFGDNFGVKSNTTLKIANPQNTTALQIGPITIVPYILYTQKSATLNVTNATPTTTFTNDQLIDNRDDATAIVYSIVGENDGVATINAETGEVTGLKPGTVTVQAAYGEATTTYQLTITGDGQMDPELTFEKETVWCKLGDTFTNALTHKGTGTVTYTSNRTDRATIDATGKVTTIFYGQVIITASIEASGFYKAAEKTYVVNIQPTETPIYELFSTVTQETAAASATWTGDTGEKWTAVYARRKSPADEINGHLATRLGATASIVSNTRLQGGIKYISFIVRQQNVDDATADNFGVRIQRINSEGTAKTNNRFSFSVNENLPVAYVVDTLGSSKPSVYADAYKLYFANESKKNNTVVKTSGAAPILIDSIAFYPYIYFKKGRTVSMKDQGSYDNMKCNVAEAEYLLNNITAADGGSVSYSIVGENYGASINAKTGEVDYSEVTEDADIKIQAKYYEAITSQILHVNALKAPVITVTGVTSGSMAKTFKDGSFKLSYTLKVGGETRTDIPLEWTSSDPTIASIDNDGNITIYMAGSVTITASNEEDIAGNLRASSYSFTLDIAGIGEDESLIERFTDITASAWTHSATSFTSTAYGTDWKVNHFTTKYNDKVLGEKAVRLSKDNGGGEINSDGNVEGGIKAVAFDWWLAGSEDQNVQFGVTAGSVAKTIKYDAIPSGSSNTTHYEQFFGVESNCNFQFLMNDYTQNSFILGPITITPYIYYKQREVLLDLNAVTTPFDSKTVLIDNTNEGTISFTSANTSVATVNATTGVITAAEGGETDVTATWSKGATTKIHVVAAEVYNRIWDLIDAEPDGTTAPVIVSFLQDIILDIDKTNKTVKILGMDGIPGTYVYVHADASVPATWKAEEGSISNKVFGYWSKNVDGSYTLTITSWDKLLYLENGEIPPVPGMQKPTVTTLNNGEDLTIGLDAAPVTLPLSVTYEKVAGTYMPVTDPNCEFTSSNENVVTIDENGQVTVVGVGTAELIAHFLPTNDYEESADTINVTVNYTDPAEGTYWKETFNSLGNKSGYQGYTSNIAGDYGVTWTLRNFRHKTSDASDQVNGEYGVRLKYNASSDSKDAYIETSSLEGGVKRLQFKWKTPGDSENPKFTVEFDSKATVDSVDQEQAAADAGTVYDFGYNANIAKNAKLTIRVTSGTCVSIFGPLYITPYLFYTEKVVEKTYNLEGTNTVDASANLINNLEVGETVTYSLSAGAQATIDGSIITLANATEDVTVTATWGEVSTTFTLKVTKAEDPVVEPDFVLENKTAGAYATICLPKQIAKVENATLYSINYGNTQEIEFVEADFENDNAGMPYLVQVAADGNVNFYYGEGEAVTEPVSAEDAKGFVGSLQEDPQEIPSDGSAILVSGGQLHIAGEWCYLTENHAYITTAYLPASAAPVGMRRTIRLYNAETHTPTGWMDVNANANVGKIIRNGQLFIIREGKVYSAQGMLVK
ncbi:MAG: Ig-like domain-containing protein [Paludibacteraceae bacterium]|nr:Ig-like domain-containing protein [Paludibacteraceae bacterium]